MLKKSRTKKEGKKKGIEKKQGKRKRKKIQKCLHPLSLGAELYYCLLELGPRQV